MSFIAAAQDPNNYRSEILSSLNEEDSSSPKNDIGEATSLLSYDSAIGASGGDNRRKGSASLLFANGAADDEDYYAAIRSIDNGSSLADDGSIVTINKSTTANGADQDEQVAPVLMPRPRAARIRNRQPRYCEKNDSDDLLEQKITVDEQLMPSQPGTSRTPSIASTASMSILLPESETGDGGVIKNDREWRSFNEASRASSARTVTRPASSISLSRPGRGFGGSVIRSLSSTSQLSNNINQMTDEPDDFSTDVFVPTVAERLRSLSTVIETHVESYQQPTNNNHNNGERLFTVIGDNSLENDLSNVKVLMSRYGCATSKMALEVSALLDKLSRLNVTMSERMVNDKKNADGLISHAKEIKASTESPERRAARILALTGECQSSIKVAEINARTAENVAKAMELVTGLMVSLDEIRQVAVEAQAEADLAREQAEAERRAEETRARRQEEARRKADELARHREEEERKRAAERERLAAEMARAAAIATGEAGADGQITAAEIARNPKYWPHFVYDKSSNYFDQGIAVIVRAFPKELEQSDISVDVLDQTDCNIELKDGEELLSNVIQLSYTREDAIDHLSIPLSILVPHCGMRLAAYREPVIKFCGKTGRWREVSSNEVTLDDYKELRFVECRLKPLGLFVVISRIKHDNHLLMPGGCVISSTVDPRVCVEVQPNTVRIQTRLTIKLHPVESALLAEFKRTIPPEEGDWLSGTSHFVFLSMLNHNIKQPLTVYIPSPPSAIGKNKNLPVKQTDLVAELIAATTSSGDPSAKKPREKEKKVVDLQAAIDAALFAERAAAMAAESGPVEEDYMNKPLTGIMGKEKEEQLVLVVYDPDLGPVIVDNVEIIESKRDNLLLTLKTVYHKFILLRTVKSSDCQPQTIIKTVTKLEEFINKRNVVCLLRQRPSAPHECIFCMSQTNRLDRINRQFNEDGFTLGNNSLTSNSRELILTEGQHIEICVSGNLGVRGGIIPTKFCFNSQFKNQLRFDVFVIDKFAQKSFDNFNGFIEVYTLMYVEHKTQDKETHRIRIEKVLERVKIAELVLKIPKRDYDDTETIEPRRQEIAIHSEDIIDEKLLRQIADEVSTEWRSLAKHLGIRKSRVNAIFEMYESRGPESCCFEALLTWFKQTQKSVNKAEALTRALSVIGRPDLAENVSDLYKDFKREKSDRTAAEKMRIAFIRISQDEQVLRSWQQLAKALQVSDSAGESIKRLNLSTRDKCMHMLNEWQSQPGSNLAVLQQRLKLGGFTTASRLVRRIEQEGL